MLESCVDCIVALDPTVEEIAAGQEVLDSFNFGCQLPSIMVSLSSTGAIGSFATASATNALPFTFSITPTISQVTASQVTVTVASTGSSTRSTLNGAPSSIVFGVFAGIILTLV
ncbi:hypothetical protein J132_11203 [Termitomyces sp. J132]|nr:hypothetical protein J132_11203 [Termitomyces sp. J132]